MAQRGLGQASARGSEGRPPGAQPGAACSILDSAGARRSLPVGAVRGTKSYDATRASSNFRLCIRKLRGFDKTSDGGIGLRAIAILSRYIRLRRYRCRFLPWQPSLLYLSENCNSYFVKHFLNSQV